MACRASGALDLVIDEIGNNIVWSIHMSIDDGGVVMTLASEAGLAEIVAR